MLFGLEMHAFVTSHRSGFKRVLSFDLVPQLSVRFRRMAYSPLGILILGFLVAVLCGLALHPRVFALAGGLGGVIAVGICWPWLTLRGTSAAVRFDIERSSEGESVPVTMEISNHLPWPAWGMLVRGGFFEGADGSVRMESAPSRTKSTFRWMFVPAVRGLYPTEAPKLSTGFPFGIWEPTQSVRSERTLTVWPRTFPVGPVPTTDGTTVIEGNVARNKVGSTGDVLGVRPYRRGDSPRRIHWAQSAKHDRFIVCELATNTRPVVLLLLDTDPAVHTAGVHGTLEWAIRATASFAKGWIESGSLVGLAVGTTVISPASGQSQLVRIMDRLAAVSDRDAVPFAELASNPKIASAHSFVRIAITTDAGMALAPRCRDVRFVSLQRGGFEGTAAIDTPGMTPWLDIPNAELMPSRLRHGWAEARHGS